MERLTEKFVCNLPDEVLEKLGIADIPKEDYEIKGTNGELCRETCEKYECDSCPIQKAIEKLADYEDAEEQGLLLRLPCKVGTKVYEVSNNTDDCCFDCDHFVVGHCCYDYCEKLNVDNPQHAEKPICEKQFLEVIEVVTNLEWIFSHRNMFGKTVFLTKEEAEQALAEMKGGSDAKTINESRT